LGNKVFVITDARCNQEKRTDTCSYSVSKLTHREISYVWNVHETQFVAVMLPHFLSLKF